MNDKMEEIMTEERETLKNRLTRGGLAPEAVQKAIEAFDAGDIHSLNFSKAGGRLICPIPQELLVRVFPKLADIPAKATVRDLDHLSLEYEINRHHGGVKSLTLKWPEELDVHDPQPKVEEPKLTLTEHAKKDQPAEVPHEPVPEIPEKTGTGAMSRGSYPGPHPADAERGPEPLPVAAETDDDTPF